MKLEKEPSVFDLERLEKASSHSNSQTIMNDPLSIYLHDIGQVKLLSREEEIELAERILSARGSTDEKVIKSGKEARDRMVVANLRLVVSIAKTYTYSNLPLMDLVQDGTMGLMKAVDRYQVEKGVKFSTYATWWIRQSISRSIANTSRTIRLPAHVYEMMATVRKAKRKYVIEHGKEPDIETVSKMTGISLGLLNLITLYREDALSLDQSVGDGDSTLNDLIEDTRHLDPDEHDQARILEESVIKLLKELSEREQMIIKMRFGIESDKKTLDEIGQSLGITRERVRQLENRAIKKLRHHMLTEGIK